MIQILITMIAVGILMWAVGLIPMDAAVRSLLRAVVIIALIVWLIKVFGLTHYINRIF